MTISLRAALVTWAMAMTACGSEMHDPVDSGIDASSIPVPDASSDAGLVTDAGSLADAGHAADASHLPDAAPSIDAGPGGDAGTTAAPCTEVGARRTVPCGNCGLAAEECAEDHTWERTSDCLSQGECGPGEVGTEALDACGMQQRICDDTCAWRDWTITRPRGECEAGTRQVVPSATCSAGFRVQDCTEDCAWMDGACDDGCGNTARTTPDWAREVCVPAGPFVRGHADVEYARPVAEIVLSAYYVDVYPVTNLRYRACVDAGVCTIPTRTAGAASFADRSRDNYPVQAVNRAMADAFCDWDGGRTLPTEAQWEKAARGPAPRAQRWVWDDDTYRCDLLQAGECPVIVPVMYTSSYVPDPYDGLPGTRSYYGTYLQYGGVFEITRDWHEPFWYSDPASLGMDPTGPSSGTQRVTRGTHRRNAGPRTGTDPFSPTTQTISHRIRDNPGDYLGIRCVRTP